MTQPTEHSHVARKQWPCLYGDTIHKGERYVRRSLPPWTMVPDDVDDLGQTLYDQLGEWVTERYHASCRDRAEGWPGADLPTERTQP